MKAVKRIVVLSVVVMVATLLVSCPANSLLTYVQDKVAQNLEQITAFSFVGFGSSTGVINQNNGTIAVTLPYGTSVTALVAAFTTSASSVKIGSVSQINGVTSNNFTTPVVYTTSGQNGSTKNYTVTVTIAAASPGEAWTAQTLPSSAFWQSVTYGNGTFVAVASGPSTTAASSPDGIHWTAQTLPASTFWDSVTYGNGVFVAVATGPSTVAATSPDGVTWTSRTLPSSASWFSVTYGNGVFVAVTGGSSTVAATSPDGVTWTARTLPSAAVWRSVTYGNGKFVAVTTANSSTAATSP
jgi:hypothetical protein